MLLPSAQVYEAECYCTTCQTRCARSELLFGPHVNHDALPMPLALTAAPSSLLREAEALLQTVQESHVKPFRLMRRQLNASLDFLRTSYAEKQRALAQLQRELATLEAEMRQAARAKALMRCNEDYQRQQLRSQVERLRQGLRVMSAAWEGTNSTATTTTQGVHEDDDTELLLLQDKEVRATALEELAQLRRVLDVTMHTLQHSSKEEKDNTVSGTSSDASQDSAASEAAAQQQQQQRTMQACMYAGRSALHATRSEALLHDCLRAQASKAATPQPHVAAAAADNNDDEHIHRADNEDGAGAAGGNNSSSRSEAAREAAMEEITRRETALRAELAEVIADIHRTIEQQQHQPSAMQEVGVH